MAKRITTKEEQDKVISIISDTFELHPDPIKENLNNDSNFTYDEVVLIAIKYSEEQNKELIKANELLSEEKREYDEMLDTLLLIPGAKKQTCIIDYCKQWIKRNADIRFHT